MKLTQEIKLCYLGGPGRFDYVVTSVPEGSDNWLIRVRGERPTQATAVTDEDLIEYANCRAEIEAVQRYINRFGPPFLIEPKGEEFLYAETLGRWRALQLQFRHTWCRILGIEVRDSFTETFGKDFPDIWKAQEPWRRVPAHGEFQLVDGDLIFLAETHFVALVIKLLVTSAAGKLRKCLNPDCSNTPYFIAEHGKTQYCCEECGKWGQRQAKLKYWHENKQRYRKQSKSASAQARSNSLDANKRRRKDGTQKAR